MTFRLMAAISCIVSIATAAYAGEQPKDTLNDGRPVPILAWGGVPSNEATPARFAEIAEAGFTHSYSGMGNADAMQKALDTAHAAGVKLVISIPELQSDPEGTAKRFKNHPGNGGYFLRDEPDANAFAELATWAKRIQSVDNAHPAYVNLLPTYATPDQMKMPTYPKYVERFIEEVPVPMLSFDHYGIVQTDNGDSVRGDYFYNLEVCSAAARKSGRPLWAFALSTAHNPYPIPTVAHLRFQVFNDLAYGAQAIEYFTYWTHKSEVWNFHQGPIESDGKRTPTYDRVKQVNGEIQKLRGAFIGSKLISVAQTGDSIPYGTTHFSPTAPVKSLETPAGGAVVSVLEKGSARYLAVVNRDLHKPMRLSVTFDPAANVKIAAKNGSLTSLKNSAKQCDIEPGDIAVFTWSK